ncbi:hypothetical protein [Hymenobacter sp. B81]|uniref:hypothetical protein n=1 Tax=Hymenobacter sp. B81 TaxID=3344878 RepID=UPI0037DCDCC2
MTLLIRCLLALLLASVATAHAQEAPIKFGKVEPRDFDATAYKGADAAPAVVLCDYGRLRIEGAHDGFKVVLERITRVLIVNKDGYEHATVHVPLYRREGKEELLTQLRGATYNLVNGQVEKHKMEDESVFHEQIDARHARRRFTLPRVREGSIIEYSYVVKSGFLYSLPTWNFQHDIPVVWSECRAELPAFFVYKEFSRGYHPYAVQTHAVVPYTTLYRASEEAGMGLSSNNTVMQRLSTSALGGRWVMQDVPAFRPEPYMTTERDYRAALDFELHLTQFDPTRPRPVTSTWEKIAAQLLKQEDFGGLLKREDFAGAFSNQSPLTAEAQALAKHHPNPAERAAAVRALVQQNLRYTGEESLFARTPLLGKLVQLRQGNAAEVNLLLVHTLRDAGLEAHPVLVSTRDHGRIQTEVPLVNQFNYVVAHVALHDQPAGLLLDATEPLAAPGTLPLRCLNGQGRLIAPGGGRWLPLTPSQKHLRLTNARLSLGEQGELRGTVNVEYNGYAGLAERGRLAENGEKAYLTRLLQQHPDWQLTRSAVQRADELTKPLLVALDLTVPPAQAAPTTLYLPLMQLFTDAQNPFQSDARSYPVDFGAAHEYVTTVQLTLPPRYRISELPGQLLLDLPGGQGRYSYEATQQGNVLQLVSRLQLRKTEYKPSEYPALRELFIRAQAKHAEPLVLQRQP